MGVESFTLTLMVESNCHTKLILWMTDSQLFFKKKKIISPKNGASEEATTRKNWASEDDFFFQRKKRKIDVIFRWGKKSWCLQTKWSGKIK